MDAPWRIQLLGVLRAEMGDLKVTRFATSRVAALLARLALHPRRAHSREELCDLLWPDADLGAARLSLRVAIASLRRQLEPSPLMHGSVLLADRSFVGLNLVAFRCDVADFEAALTTAGDEPEALARAAALYGGDLLPGFYDDWIVEERERLAALHEECCAQLQHEGRAARTSIPPYAAVAEADAAPPARAPRLVRLPLQFTRFFGREEEITHIAALLAAPDTRLVTLSGPGGVGKTRLALEAVRQVADHSGGLVCFVPLADLSDAHLIPDAVAAALGLARTDDAAPLDEVTAALSDLPPALLVLDNFEQLVERGAPLVLSLLTRLPTLTCLVTSRRRLSLPGEHEVPVLPLPVPPPPNAPETPAQVSQAAAARLFVDRAQAARPDFQLTRGNAVAVSSLCRHLEGIPLAIELVAARAMALSPAQMDERLAHRFEVLTSWRGDKDGCHRSLWAAVAWSYDLIPALLQRFFAGLSVFRGGCTAEAAAAVCEEPSALEFLTQLRERSLVTVEHSGAEPRFRLLETLREFAEEQLDPEDRAWLRVRHGEHFTALAQSAAPALRGPHQDQWLERLSADEDNLRAALDRGKHDTARALFAESLAVSHETGEEGDTAVALCGLARLARHLGQLEEARTCLAEHLALHHKQGDTRQITVTLEECAACALALGYVPLAARLLGASAALAGALSAVSTPAEAAETARLVAHLRLELGEAAYTAQVEEGKRLTCEEAVEEAVGEAMGKAMGKAIGERSIV